MYLKTNALQLIACILLFTAMTTHTAEQQKYDPKTDSELCTRILTLPKDLQKEIISFFPPGRLQRLMYRLKQPLPITHMGIMSCVPGIPRNAVIIASQAVTARPG